MAALAAEPPPPTPADPSKAELGDHVDTLRSPELAPKLLVGGGAVLIATAGILLATNPKPNPTGLQMPTYTDYAPPAYALAATGAVAIGAGVYWWVHKRSSSAPVAAMTRNGTVLGWAGRF
jgi:hypothetical protein